MPLVLLHLGNEVTRFTNEIAARKEGSRLHTRNKPARIEITPDGGGCVTSLKYDAHQAAWIIEPSE